MSTIARDARRIGTRTARPERATTRGLVGRIAAWWASDATMQRFTAERQRDQRLVRGCR